MIISILEYVDIIYDSCTLYNKIYLDKVQLGCVLVCSWELSWPNDITLLSK